MAGLPHSQPCNAQPPSKGVGHVPQVTDPAKEFPMITRLILRADCDCDSCGCPLMAGEVAYRDEKSGAVGHTQECCLDRAAEIADHREHLAFLSGFDRNLVAGVR